MLLSDMPNKDANRLGRSSVDRLPVEVRDQLVAARRADTHSVSTMVEWLRTLGHDTVSVNALNNWFNAHRVDRGGASE
jgi:hypothetical protein